MHILNRKLTPEQQKIFELNPVDIRSARKGGLFIDLSVVSLILLSSFFQTSWILWMFTGLYGLFLLIIGFFINKYMAYAYDEVEVPFNEYQSYFMRGSATIDWPFRKESLPFTLKHTFTILVGLYTGYLANPYLGTLMITTVIMQQYLTYLHGKITLKLLDGDVGQLIERLKNEGKL